MPGAIQSAETSRAASRAIRGVLVLLLAVAFSGCSSVSRRITSGLPDWLVPAPGAEESTRLRELLLTKEWTEEEIATQRAEVDAIEALYGEEEYSDAVDRIEAFLEQYPSTDFDERLRYLLGMANYRDDDLKAAFRNFREFSDLYVVSDYYDEIMEVVYGIGKEYIEGEHSAFFGIFPNKGTGERMLNFVVERFPTGRRAPDAQWLVATYYFEDEGWLRADAAYKYLAETWPDSPWAAPSLYNSAYAKYRLVKGVVYDPLSMERARKAFETYIEKVPDGPERGTATKLKDELVSREASHLLSIAEWYIGQDKAYSSRLYLNELRARFPQSAQAKRARELLAQTLPAGEVLPPDPEPKSDGDEPKTKEASS
jgi:outer membrane protein assembly factor BamD (BamD/ComL family)